MYEDPPFLQNIKIIVLIDVAPKLFSFGLLLVTKYFQRKDKKINIIESIQDISH